VLCAQADRCVALDSTQVRPPRLADDRYSRTAATAVTFGWPLKAAITAVLWLFGVRVALRASSAALPLLIFLGVPYVAVTVAVTRDLWRSRRVGTSDIWNG
jgi:protein-S-isoprenylcysteine O-methyltransferase Ste14